MPLAALAPPACHRSKRLAYPLRLMKIWQSGKGQDMKKMLTAEVTVRKRRTVQSEVNSIRVSIRWVEATTDKETSDQAKTKPTDEDLPPELSSLISNGHRE